MKTVLLALLILFSSGHGLAQHSILINKLSILPIQQERTVAIQSRPLSLPNQFDFDAFAQRYLVYPEMARDYAISGRVILELTVSCDGTITHIAVVKKLGYGCDEAAIALAEKLPPLLPALDRGHPITSKTKLEIKFSRE